MTKSVICFRTHLTRRKRCAIAWIHLQSWDRSHPRYQSGLPLWSTWESRSHYRQSGKLVGKAKLSYLEMILNNQKSREKRKGLEYRPDLIALSYFLNNIINNYYISLMPFFFLEFCKLFVNTSFFKGLPFPGMIERCPPGLESVPTLSANC